MTDDQYDDLIQRAVEQFAPWYDWRMYRAQLEAESGLRADAVSPVGAMGLAQFMPGTWRDVAVELGLGDDPSDPADAIKAGAYYMGTLYGQWTAPRPEADRISLSLASYNAGLANILNAQRLSGGEAMYAHIMAQLHHVTGRHHTETIGYVRRIWKFYAQAVSAIKY